jgi:hypothetical protein
LYLQAWACISSLVCMQGTSVLVTLHNLGNPITIMFLLHPSGWLFHA